MLIDSHAHLDEPYLRDNLSSVLERARLEDVKKVVTIGVTPTSSRECMEIASRYPEVYATVGYHPHWAKGAGPNRLTEIETLARDPAVAALGEIGLDFHHFHSPRKPQLELFRNMLEIASTLGLPVIIHDRKAHEEVYDILFEFRACLTGGIMHCFSGNWDLARKYLDWGFFLSIPGPVTYSSSHDLREVAQKAPLDQILLETDAPYLTPAPHRGKKNEPAFVRYTAMEIARIRNTSLEKIAQVTTENVFNAFRIQELETRGGPDPETHRPEP